MATAILKKRRPKVPARELVEVLEEDRSASFYMPAGSMTLDDFRKWTRSDDFPESGKIAYIGKEIFIDMSPERIDCHGLVKTAICTVIGSLVLNRNMGNVFFDGIRIVNVPAAVSNEPDAVFIRWESLQSDRVRKVPTQDENDYIEFEGAPDWVLEIVSPSSVTKDKKKLPARYFRAGVSEYWLVDARGKDLDFQIFNHGEEEYEPAERVGVWQVSQVFGKKFRLRRIKNPLGGVDYRLDMK
jgi:Uma2 family endonuclease